MGRPCQVCELPAHVRERLRWIRQDGNSLNILARIAREDELPTSRSGIHRHFIKNHDETKSRPKPSPTPGPIVINPMREWDDWLRKFGGNVQEAQRAWRLRQKRLANHAAALRAKLGHQGP